MARRARPDSLEQELEDLLSDAEATVLRLREELSLRRGELAQIERRAEQHHEIDRLREHLAEAQVHWGRVHGFVEAALNELRERRHDTSESESGSGSGEPG